MRGLDADQCAAWAHPILTGIGKSARFGVNAAVTARFPAPVFRASPSSSPSRRNESARAASPGQRVPDLLRLLVGKQGAKQFLRNVDVVLVGNFEAQLDRHADLEAHGYQPCRTKDQVMALPNPTGTHKVKGVARMPTYSYNPKVN